MKYEWEARDIEAGRRLVGWNASDEHLIGYAIEDGRFNLVRLTDGHIDRRSLLPIYMAAYLTAGGYRPMTIRHDLDQPATPPEGMFGTPEERGPYLKKVAQIRKEKEPIK